MRFNILLAFDLEALKGAVNHRTTPVDIIENGYEQAWQLVGFKSRTFRIEPLRETELTVFELVPLRCGSIALPPITCNGWLWEDEETSHEPSAASRWEVAVGGGEWAFSDYHVFVHRPLPIRAQINELFSAAN